MGRQQGTEGNDARGEGKVGGGGSPSPCIRHLILQTLVDLRNHLGTSACGDLHFIAYLYQAYQAFLGTLETRHCMDQVLHAVQSCSQHRCKLARVIVRCQANRTVKCRETRKPAPLFGH